MKWDACNVLALSLAAALLLPSASAASSADKKRFIEPVTGMEFLLVPAGCFEMGDTFGDGNRDEQPVHEVCVDSFYIGTYEVTQGQYQQLMETNPSRFSTDTQYPVEQVSWNDARQFIAELNQKSGRNYRLPTEAEWEYAARSGGKKEKFAGGNELDSVAWYWSYRDDIYSTKQVGSKMANGLGIFDMSGNVWEWCSDWYNSTYYNTSEQTNPPGPSSGSTRVARGGAWSNHPWHMRASFRAHYPPERRVINLGFRLVHAAQQPSP